MAFPKSVIKLAHDNADALCMKSARAMHGAGLKAFREIPLAELARRLKTTLAEQVHYLEHQDMNAWQEFTVRIVEDRISRGMSAWDVIRAGQLMLDILSDFFASQLGAVKVIEGQDASKVLERLQARIQGMNVVATTMATRVGIKHAKA